MFRFFGSKTTYAAVRNHAVAVARGEWVCFVDSDDLIHPQMLEHLYEAAINSGAGISMCGLKEAEHLPDGFFNKCQAVFSTIQIDASSMEEFYSHGEHRYWVTVGKLIRRDILDILPFTEGRIYEDNAVVCRWLHEAQVVANTQQRYYFYQVNQGSTTKSTFSIKKLDFLWAMEEQFAFYKKVGYTAMEKNIAAYYLKTAAWYSSRVRNELNNIQAAADVRRRMKRVLREYPLESLPMTDAEKIEIRRAFHPLAAQIRRIPRVVCETLAGDGIGGLGRRILRKFKKYE